jgi:NAD(P)-dependent dehydrogenase (short-subunit alcohol dehydrogenase family)
MAVPSLKGRVAVVTGATSGLGRGIAQRLAELRATVVVVGRSEARAVAAAGEVAAQSGNPEVYPMAVGDLAVRSEVARLASALLERYPSLHILVNNAGGYFHRREVTPEGLERTFALNVLAPFLLTTKLLPRLLESAPSRIVMVASAAHRGHQVNFADLQFDHGYRAYGRSKLELLLLTREFAHRLVGRPVTVNAVHPGFVASGFGRNNGGAVGFGFALAERLFARSVRAAAEEVVDLAVNPAVATVSGEYFARNAVHPGSSASRDMVSALRLYEACAELAKPFA